MIWHAQSRILCLPQIVTNRYPDRARLSWVLRQHSVLGKVVDKIYGCARREGQLAPCLDLAVQLAPCFEFAAPPESSNERVETVGDDDDDELCIVCSHGKRNWKWGGCTHKTDGPSLICLQCRGALLRAEREAQRIVDDNRRLGRDQMHHMQSAEWFPKVESAENSWNALCGRMMESGWRSWLNRVLDRGGYEF